jgi:glucosyl-dolichyl phosphate glucuronosyltransferase
MTPQTPRTPAVSVVIPCHSEERWTCLVAAVESARAQRLTPAEIVVVVDHNPQLYSRIRRELSGVTALENRYTKGVSGNRNTGAFHTTTELIAFLDDDAVADPEWLGRLVAPFADPAVIGTGGGINPNWLRARPGWFPDEFLWAVGGSYTGMPSTTAPIRNVWSASMAVRRERFMAVGGFLTGFGKEGSRNRPEDTELCLRMARDGGGWMYVPDAVIAHAVPAGRDNLRFFLKRCYAEGRGKVQMAGLNDGDSLGSERDYLRRTLPHAVVREIAAAGRGRGAKHALRAGAVLIGVAAAGFGALVEVASAARPQRRALTAEGAR